MFQSLVCFAVQPEYRHDFVQTARTVARDSHRFEVIADAEGPTWLMRGNHVGDEVVAS